MIGTVALMLGLKDTWARIALCIVETVRLMLGLTDTRVGIAVYIIETVRLMLGLGWSGTLCGKDTRSQTQG